MKNPRGIAGQVTKAVKALREELAKVDSAPHLDTREKRDAERSRLTELIRLASGSGEVDPDPANQGEKIKPIAKPKLF